MATNKESEIKILNSQSAGATPDVSQMEYGELAINTADSTIYFKNGTGSLGSISGNGSGAVPALKYTARTAEESVGAGQFRVADDLSSVDISLTDADSDDLTEFFEGLKVSGKGTLYYVNEEDGEVGVLYYNNVSPSSTYSNVYTLSGSFVKPYSAFSSGDNVKIIIAPTDIGVILPRPPGNQYVFETHQLPLNVADWQDAPQEGQAFGWGAWNGDPTWIGILTRTPGAELDIGFGRDIGTVTLDEDADGNTSVQAGFYLEQLIEQGSSGNLGFIKITNADDYSQYLVAQCQMLLS